MPRHANANATPVRLYRYVRTCVHVGAGVATTLFVFPLVSAARKRALVKRWSRRLLRILAVEARLHGDIGARGGNVLVVANHISWLDIFVLNSVHPVRFVAKSELARWPVDRRDDPRRGHAVHRAHAAPRHPPRQPSRRRRAGSGRRRRDLSGRHDDGWPRHAAVQEFAACSRSWKRRAMCSRWRSATARPTARCRSRLRTSARRRSRNRSGRCAACARSALT